MAIVLWDIVHNGSRHLEPKDEHKGYFDGIDDLMERIIEKMDENGIIINDLIN
jgi:hypothetical protein